LLCGKRVGASGEEATEAPQTDCFHQLISLNLKANSTTTSAAATSTAIHTDSKSNADVTGRATFRLIASASSNRATYVNVECNGQGVKALVDTGAYTSMISAARAIRCGLEFKALDETRTWQTANGGRLRTIARSVTTIKIGNTTLQKELVVAEDLSQELIIGTDILRATGAIIRFDTNELIINKATIGLEVAGEKNDERSTKRTEDVRSKKIVTVAGLTEKIKTEWFPAILQDQATRF
jgi:clan AA aspartic protease (TIGR02281 family)